MIFKPLVHSVLLYPSQRSVVVIIFRLRSRHCKLYGQLTTCTRSVVLSPICDACACIESVLRFAFVRPSMTYTVGHGPRYIGPKELDYGRSNNNSFNLHEFLTLAELFHRAVTFVKSSKRIL